MSRQEYIVRLEGSVVDAIEALRMEVAREGTGKVHPENSDYWGTLMVNCSELIRLIKQYR